MRRVIGLRLCCAVPVWVIAAGSAVAQAPPSIPRSTPVTLTAQQVVDTIRGHIGVPWKEPTVDTFKAGDPATPVTGIAVTMMATLDVLQRAAESGHNMVITHEPTFFTGADATTALESERDQVFAAKQAFIRDHGLVVWRFHDNWHRRQPDGIHAGIVRALGWQSYATPGNDHVFTIPPVTLRQLATVLAGRLGAQAPRVIGDPQAVIRTVALSEGSQFAAFNRHLFQTAGVDVLVIGESPEWETAEYAADAVTAGRRKGLIVLGHIPSEQAGMEEAALWLRSILPTFRVDFLATRDPFWVPR